MIVPLASLPSVCMARLYDALISFDSGADDSRVDLGVWLEVWVRLGGMLGGVGTG